MRQTLDISHFLAKATLRKFQGKMLVTENYGLGKLR